MGRHSNLRLPPKLNKFFQRGVCMSPPLPRPDPICRNQSTEVDGYNFEMHIFEYIDHTLFNSRESLVAEYEKRRQRIANCSHTFHNEELSVIMGQINY